MPNPQNIEKFKFKKGVVTNPNGRPKKYTTILRESGYKLAEINDTIQVMLQMTIAELNDVYKNENSTILEKTIANAMKKSLERGSLYSIDTLLTRVYGKPKETAAITTSNRIEIVYVEGKTIL
jgi:hypothetical protein